MSMIYECPTCHAPQPAGATACGKCGAEFDGAVPDDAILPAAAQTPATGRGAVAAASEAVTLPPSPGAGPVVTAPPPPAESLPYQSPPTYAPPNYQPPPAYAEPPSYQNAPQTAGPIPKALLIALPILLLIVLGGVLIARSLDQTPVVTPTAVGSTPGPLPPAPTGQPGPPTTLPGATSGGTDNSPAAQSLIGQWKAQNTDFYVFNADGSGAQGTVTGRQPQASFQWSLAQNQLILYKDKDKQEKLVFSAGPDDNTMFLRSESGKYVEYARAKS